MKLSRTNYLLSWLLVLCLSTGYVLRGEDEKLENETERSSVDREPFLREIALLLHIPREQVTKTKAIEACWLERLGGLGAARESVFQKARELQGLLPDTLSLVLVEDDNCALIQEAPDRRISMVLNFFFDEHARLKRVGCGFLIAPP